ncbi:MAG: hypothetical protein GY853_14140 [PVC group bacterium]|nr:hypothetical protein [PVC group bacterium]
MKTLLVLSVGVEFGWLLCTFIPAIRYKSRGYNRTVIVCDPEHRYLYQDFATDFVNYNKKIEGVGYYGWSPKKKLKMPRGISRKYPGAKIITPTKKICTDAPMVYYKYGKYNDKLHSDIIIHARSEAKFNREKRNWPIHHYVKLIKKLRAHRDLSVCSVGTKEGAHHIPGTLDLRGIPLEALCNRMASSSVVVGCSSGPLHLASLCGCPHVVWTDKKYQEAIKGTNKDRYKKLWNPFGTPVKVIDVGWQPSIEVVYEVLR